MDKKAVSGYEFQFNTSDEGGDFPFNSLLEEYDANQLAKAGDYSMSKNLPAPAIVIDSIDNPCTGNIFLATWDRNIPHKYGNFIFILDKDGNIVDSSRVNGAPFNFQVQPNGRLSYARGDYAGMIPALTDILWQMILDENLTPVDSFTMKNGYMTDFHEFLLLPNGHALMMSYHEILYDMSLIVPGGRTDASLVINVIQEQDSDKNVVFEWRNIDYIPITESDLDLTDTRMN